VIRTLGVAAALAGAILLAPVAQAKPHSSTGPANSTSAATVAPIYAGPTGANKANKVGPTTLATPFGGTIARQPGLVTALANGNRVVSTGIPLGTATPMTKGNMVGPATTTTPVSGVIRTRRGLTGATEGTPPGFTGGTSPLEVLGGLLRGGLRR
jgi:hypothetical protein